MMHNGIAVGGVIFAVLLAMLFV
ncbi:MAG: hypothetical protein RL722_2255, partial [Pseudomonadota bacterium]